MKQQSIHKSMSESVAKKLVLNEIIKDNYKYFSEFLSELELSAFSHTISLQEYQQSALKCALIALKLYMGESAQNHSDEVQIVKFKTSAQELLKAYHSYQRQNLSSLIDRNEINRASFWMATGSGKTIVMIKLVVLLSVLMKRGQIPQKPIMLLAPNDKILGQFRAQIQAFNAFNTTQIHARDLKDFEKISFDGSLFDETLLYIARSDLLDTAENVGKDSKAKRLNYKNFLNQSGWYILLDEAHKGDSKDSVRKGYFNALASGFASNGELAILRQNDFARGFIFNFSATFEDNLDLTTCAFNYNLERFNNDNYGKNIAVLDSDLRAFKESGNDELKREKIIESFIIFCAIKLSKERLFDEFSKYENLQKMPLNYHNPLIIAVSDKVNTQEAGVKLYFEAILQILANDKNIKPIASELKKKLQKANLYFSTAQISAEFLDIVASVDSAMVRKSVFYADELSSIEACKIKGNDKELAFQSKNANKPFMLLNIGNIKEWEKHYLQGLGVESGEDLGQSYFDTINENSSPINIMMGSKVFNEGWDSNRVNLICFINIGSKNAKKYVLQTIGRGVRIEPFLGVRKRFMASDIDALIKDKLNPFCAGLEILFIMASDYAAIEGILEGIESFKTSGAIKGFKIKREFEPLLVPKYKDGQIRDENYAISSVDFERLRAYIKGYDEDILLLNGGAKSVDLGFSTLMKIHTQQGFEMRGSRANLTPKNAFVVIDKFFHSKKKEFKEFRNLNGEICHFQKITSTLDELVINEINKKIKELVNVKVGKSEAELMQEVKQGKISIEDYTTAIKSNTDKSTQCYGYTLNSNLSQHYYNPLIINENDKGSTVYAIRHSSEIEFLQDLQEYIARQNNALKDCKWCFCRLVENVDDIFVPYFDESVQEMRKFYPDFIFWIKTKDEFHIIFIDPKGLTHEQNPRDKLKGFQALFEGKNLTFENTNVKVNLVYYNKQGSSYEDFKSYVCSDIETIFKQKLFLN